MTAFAAPIDKARAFEVGHFFDTGNWTETRVLHGHTDEVRNTGLPWSATLG